MRTLIRYLVGMGLVLGLAWASITVKVRGKTAFAYAQQADWSRWRSEATRRWTAWTDQAGAWWASVSRDTASAPADGRKAAPTPRTAQVPPRPRSAWEVPPTELQEDEEAEERVSLLAEAARRAEAAPSQEAPVRAHATPKEKKALDALLTNREARGR